LSCLNAKLFCQYSCHSLAPSCKSVFLSAMLHRLIDAFAVNLSSHLQIFPCTLWTMINSFFLSQVNCSYCCFVMFSILLMHFAVIVFQIQEDVFSSLLCLPHLLCLLAVIVAATSLLSVAMVERYVPYNIYVLSFSSSTQYSPHSCSSSFFCLFFLLHATTNIFPHYPANCKMIK